MLRVLLLPHSQVRSFRLPSIQLEKLSLCWPCDPHWLGEQIVCVNVFVQKKQKITVNQGQGNAMNAAEIACAFTVVIERQIGKRWKGRKCSKGWGLRNAGCLFLIENDLLWKTLYKTIHHAFLSWFSLVWRVDICPSAGWLKLSRVFVGWLCVCVCVCGVCSDQFQVEWEGTGS